MHHLRDDPLLPYPSEYCEEIVILSSIVCHHQPSSLSHLELKNHSIPLVFVMMCWKITVIDGLDQQPLDASQATQGGGQRQVVVEFRLLPFSFVTL